MQSEENVHISTVAAPFASVAALFFQACSAFLSGVVYSKMLHASAVCPVHSITMRHPVPVGETKTYLSAEDLLLPRMSCLYGQMKQQ